MNRSPEINKEIEDAIKFLVFTIHESRKNPKPVILHSIRVGFHLDGMDYTKEIVIAAILHDLLEDSDTTLAQIKSRFGEKIAILVEANSFDESIRGKVERYRENFNRCFRIGREALIIKAADIIDNNYYYHLAPKKDLAKYLLGKMKYFIDYSEEILKNEPIFKELEEQYNKIAKML